MNSVSPIYKLLFKTAAETLLTIATDSKHLGAHIGVTESCGSPMLIIETFYAAYAPRAPPIGQP